MRSYFESDAREAHLKIDLARAPLNPGLENRIEVRDVDEYPGGYQLRGRYSIDQDKVSVRAFLFQQIDKSVELSLDGSKTTDTDLEELVGRLVERVAEEINASASTTVHLPDP